MTSGIFFVKITFSADEKQMNDMGLEGDNGKPEKLNQDWRKYNQEFHSGFNQFEIKDSFRTHLLLDTPDYFLKAEHDLILWRDREHGG
jgi:hypothetical protein